MADIITYVDVTQTKSTYDANDIIVVQDKSAATSGATAAQKYAAMQKTTLSPMRLFMQSGMTVDLTFADDTLTLVLKDAGGNTINTETVSITAGVSDVQVDGVSVVTSGVANVTGKYSKPDTGIPKTDLASDVQTSLGKADTAIQSHQDISGKANVSDLNAHTGNANIHVTSSDKTTWNSKQDQLVSGTNIKTINNETILGSGNITISGGGIVIKGEKTGAELAAMTASDVENGWSYFCTSAYSTFEANALYTATVSGSTLTWAKTAVIDLSGYVPTSRTINSYPLSSNVTISLTDLPDYEAISAQEVTDILTA